jgi:hypothetical protein
MENDINLVEKFFGLLWSVMWSFLCGRFRVCLFGIEFSVILSFGLCGIFLGNYSREISKKMRVLE